jgi:hypothetical protein
MTLSVHVYQQRPLLLVDVYGHMVIHSGDCLLDDAG